LKNLFKIHSVTYVVLISVLFAGYFNYLLIIAFILIMHDLAHIFFIKLFKYKIDKIIILPFGSIINSNINLNSSSKKIFLISIAGVLAQTMLFPLMLFLYNSNILNHISYNIFLNYNKMILLFNLIPIIPLDGSKMLLCLFENIFPFKKALNLINFISILGIIIFIVYLSFNGLNSYLIVVFLMYKTIEEIKEHKYIFNKFLLTRHLSNPYGKKVKYVLKIKGIFKNRFNFINNENEIKVLNTYYNKKN